MRLIQAMRVLDDDHDRLKKVLFDLSNLLVNLYLLDHSYLHLSSTDMTSQECHFNDKNEKEVDLKSKERE